MFLDHSILGTVKFCHLWDQVVCEFCSFADVRYRLQIGFNKMYSHFCMVGSLCLHITCLGWLQVCIHPSWIVCTFVAVMCSHVPLTWLTFPTLVFSSIIIQSWEEQQRYVISVFLTESKLLKHLLKKTTWDFFHYFKLAFFSDEYVQDVYIGSNFILWSSHLNDKLFRNETKSSQVVPTD